MSENKYTACFTLNDAGSRLRQLFDETGERADIDEAILIASATLDNLPSEAPLSIQHMVVGGLANLYLARAAR